jgi:hypothetical protein
MVVLPRRRRYVRSISLRWYADVRSSAGRSTLPACSGPLAGGERLAHELWQAGEEDDGLPVPMNPNEVEPEAGSEPLYDTLLTDTELPLLRSVPFQI